VLILGKLELPPGGAHASKKTDKNKAADLEKFSAGGQAYVEPQIKANGGQNGKIVGGKGRVTERKGGAGPYRLRERTGDSLAGTPNLGSAKGGFSL